MLHAATGLTIVRRHEEPAAPAPTVRPEEASVLSPGAAPRRRIEFALGRAAAREALIELGMDDPPPVVHGKYGEPLWPEGVTGSITHTRFGSSAEGSPRATAIAAVARKSAVEAAGIDVESLERSVSPEIGRHLCANENESRWTTERGAEANERMLMLVTAKEALFKALFPLCGVHFSFKDAALEWNAAGGLFRAELLRDLGPRFPKGFHTAIRVEKAEGLLLALAVLPCLPHR